jgi:hypothetical protein
MTIETLKKSYEKVVNDYLKVFAKKYELDIDDVWWIGNIVGVGMLQWGDMYTTFDDLKEDVDNGYNFFLEWYWQGVDTMTNDSEQKIINLKSYAMGLRYDMTTDQQRLIKEGFEYDGGSEKGLYECYNKKLDEITSIKVTYPLFEVILKQHVQSIELHSIVNIQQLFSFIKQF